ncbi:MAG: ribose 5-phosphate isomerase A-domain-containing protein, partial [Benjaminiella poitrasii]
IMTDSTGLSKKRIVKSTHVPTACIHCKKAHLACDLSRPCKRCYSLGKSDSCVDIRHKKRGRPKLTSVKKWQSTNTLSEQHSQAMTSFKESKERNKPAQAVMTLFLSMDLCCIRVSDECLQFLNTSPSKISQCSLYDLIHIESSETLSRLHRILLDNCHQNVTQPISFTSASSESFLTTSAPRLMTIANGSQTLKETLRFKTSLSQFNCQFYLGGGLGGDLFKLSTLNRLYMVCLMTRDDKAINVHNILPSPPPYTAESILECDMMLRQQQQPNYSPLLSANSTTNDVNTIDLMNHFCEAIMSPCSTENNNPTQISSQDNSLVQNRRGKLAWALSLFFDYLIIFTPFSVYTQFIQCTVKMSSELIENGKRLAAYRAVDEYITSDCNVVGIGSGSTVIYVIERILQKPELKDIVYVPTSFQSRLLIADNGLKLGTIEQNDEIDVTIDGADEVDENLNAIKGGGACQFQEKLVAEAAKKFVIVADFRKESKKLGTQWTKGVPIEVVPLCYRTVIRKMENELSLKPKSAKLRMAVNKAGPVVTDNGNFVVDVDFGQLEDPASLLKEIKLLTGVYEVGLFCNMASIAYFGEQDGTVNTLVKK